MKTCYNCYKDEVVALSNDFIDFCEKNHLRKSIIKRKIEFLSDLKTAVTSSISGRMGAEVSFSFLVEAEHMTANSIKQFELGYFDAAFYSLRSILELFMLLVYFIEHQTIDLGEHLKKWNRLDRMDTFSRMDSYLSTRSDLYKDITSQMEEYFESIRELNRKLNKIVHKQSFFNFYASRSHPIASSKYDFDKEQEFFEEAVEKIIGAIIVFRLFIDPIPVLLMDREIYLRTKDTMSGPLTDNFISKYIGDKNIEAYKKCEFYELHYEQFMQDTKFHESVAELMKYKYIDMTKKSEIMEQFGELYEDDKLAFKIACESDMIYAIDVWNGVSKYSTSNIPKEKQPYIKNMEHKKYFNLKDDVLNLKYEDMVISIFVVDEKQKIFIEQAENLNKSALEKIRTIIDEYCKSVKR